MEDKSERSHRDRSGPDPSLLDFGLPAELVNERSTGRISIVGEHMSAALLRGCSSPFEQSAAGFSSLARAIDNQGRCGAERRMGRWRGRPQSPYEPRPSSPPGWASLFAEGARNPIAWVRAGAESAWIASMTSPRISACFSRRPSSSAISLLSSGTSPSSPSLSHARSGRDSQVDHGKERGCDGRVVRQAFQSTKR